MIWMSTTSLGRSLSLSDSRSVPRVLRWSTIVFVEPRSSGRHPSSWISFVSGSYRSLSSPSSSSRLTGAQFRRSLLSMGIRACPLSLSLSSRADRRSTSIQLIGRAAAAARRPRASSSADNVHRTRVARRQHALAQSSGRAPRRSLATPERNESTRGASGRRAASA